MTKQQQLRRRLLLAHQCVRNLQKLDVNVVSLHVFTGKSVAIINDRLTSLPTPMIKQANQFGVELHNAPGGMS